MIWVLACNNMYRNERHFGSLYHNPIILETVSILASKHVNGSTQKIFYIKIQRQGIILAPMCLCQGKMWKSHVKNIFHIPRWPVGGKSNYADDIFKRIFFNKNVWISIKISLKFVPKDPINNIPALVQIMAWRRSGDKPLSEPMMVSLPKHICVTRPQRVKRMLNMWEYMENIRRFQKRHLSPIKNQTIYSSCYTLPRGRNEVLKKRNGYDHSFINKIKICV